jgi:hypothetical protein
MRSMQDDHSSKAQRLDRISIQRSTENLIREYKVQTTSCSLPPKTVLPEAVCISYSFELFCCDVDAADHAGQPRQVVVAQVAKTLMPPDMESPLRWAQMLDRSQDPIAGLAWEGACPSRSGSRWSLPRKVLSTGCLSRLIGHMSVLNLKSRPRLVACRTEMRFSA